MREYPGKLISILYRKSQIFWSHYLKDHDITAAEYPVIIVLSRNNGITQEEIATELGADKSGITRVVKSLLEKGFIERKKDKEDLRCNRIYLTEKGYSGWEIIKMGMDKWNSIMSMDMVSGDVDEVVNGLLQMVDNVEKHMKK